MKGPSKSAAKLFVLENNDPISAETEAIQSRIRQRAFEISQTRPPDAHEIYDWIVAESEIISVPPTELIETESKFEVKFAVAGVSADDVNVMVTPDQILLKCDYSHRHDSSAGTVHLCDFKSATVFRSVNLPHSIDVNTVKLNFSADMVVISAVKNGAESTGRKRTGVHKAPSKKSRPRTS